MERAFGENPRRRSGGMRSRTRFRAVFARKLLRHAFRKRIPSLRRRAFSRNARPMRTPSLGVRMERAFGEHVRRRSGGMRSRTHF
eukprot:3272746-Lingulodinium_polyedra.AAC.1